MSFATLGQLRMLLNIDDLTDSDFQTYDQLKNLRGKYLDQDEIFIVVRKSDSSLPTKSEICAVSRWIQRTVDTRGDLHAVISTLGILWPTETVARFQVLPILSPDCADRNSPEKEHIEGAFKQIAASPWSGTLTSHDGRDLAILIYPAARMQASLMGTFNSRIVEELRNSFEQEVLSKHKDLRAYWIGDSVFQFHLQKGYEFMPVLNLLMSLIVLASFRWFFGTFKSGLLFLILVGAATVPMYAGMALAGHPIDVLTSSLSLMIFISSLEDYVFVSYFLRTNSWRRAYQKLLLPSFFTSLTTAIGFGSLVFADLGMIRRFGLWSGIAAMLEWAILFLILPAVLVKWPKFIEWIRPTDKVNFKLKALTGLRPRKPLTILALAVFPLIFWAAGKLHVSDSPERLLGPRHESRQALDVIESSRGWRANVSLVFRDHQNDVFNKAVIAKVRRWRNVDQVEDLYSVRDFLTAHLTPSMQTVLSGLINQTTIGHRLGPSGAESRAVVYVKGLDIEDVNQMRHETGRLCPQQECWLAGSLVSYGELGERILGTLYESLGVSLVIVSLILAFLCLATQPSALLSVLLSSLWGPIALLIFFALFNIPVFYATSMIASILVGLAGDNAIQFLFFSSGRKSVTSSIEDIGPAALIVALAGAFMFTSFFFGYFEPMRILGGAMIVGIALVFIGDVWILRGLMDFSWTSFGGKRRS